MRMHNMVSSLLLLLSFLLLLAALPKASFAFVDVVKLGKGKSINAKTFIRQPPPSFPACTFVRSMVTTTSTSTITSTSTSSSDTVTTSQTNTDVRLGDPVCEYHNVQIPMPVMDVDVNCSDEQQLLQPRQEIVVQDLTGIVQDLLERSQIMAGTVTVISRHTTTSIVINERESRLFRDMARVFRNLVPPDERSITEGAPGIRYYHNDIDQRPEGDDEAQRCRDNGWKIDDPEQLQAWRDQEPINAHSHLLSMLLGSSESIPVVHGKMVLGTWQSILLVDLDGPRQRTVGIQIMGYTQNPPSKTNTTII